MSGLKLAGKPEVELDPASTDVKVIRVQLDPEKAKLAGVTDLGVPITIRAVSAETGDEIERESIYYGLKK